MTTYAIIMDWVLYENPPTIACVRTSSDINRLRSVGSYSPAGPFTTLLRSDFNIYPVEPTTLVNRYTGARNPAHICELA